MLGKGEEKFVCVRERGRELRTEEAVYVPGSAKVWPILQQPSKVVRFVRGETKEGISLCAPGNILNIKIDNFGLCQA